MRPSGSAGFFKLLYKIVIVQSVAFHSEAFSGHIQSWTSATTLVNARANMTTLKRKIIGMADNSMYLKRKPTGRLAGVSDEAIISSVLVVNNNRSSMVYPGNSSNSYS